VAAASKRPFLFSGSTCCVGTSSLLRGGENLRAEIFFTCREDQIMLGADGKFLIDRLRPAFYNFIFTFPELAFHDFKLEPY
jgi:hypothetical protein